MVNPTTLLLSSSTVLKDENWNEDIIRDEDSKSKVDVSTSISEENVMKIDELNSSDSETNGDGKIDENSKNEVDSSTMDGDENIDTSESWLDSSVTEGNGDVNNDEN